MEIVEDFSSAYRNVKKLEYVMSTTVIKVTTLKLFIFHFASGFPKRVCLV